MSGPLRGVVPFVALLQLGGLFARGAEPAGPCADCTAVFYSGLNESRCFRIPTIIKTHLGTLLAFAENRITGCGDDYLADAGDTDVDDLKMVVHNLVVRRSHDLGQTWGPLITVRRGTKPCHKCPAATSNPNPVEVKFPDGSYKVLLHYDTLNNPTPEKHGLDMKIWSGDDGATWGNASSLDIPPLPNTGGMIGPSVGLQGASGTLYFSARPVQKRLGNFLYWSKDYGETWTMSPLIPETHTETSIAWLHNSSDERIIMSVREGPTRAQVIFDKDGTPGPLTHPDGLVDPGCQGSILNHAGALYLSNANSKKPHDRSHMTVKTSTDQGTTWSSGLPVWAGPSGYSQLVGLDDRRLGLLFEAGKEKTYETISFAAIELPQSRTIAEGVLLV